MTSLSAIRLFAFLEHSSALAPHRKFWLIFYFPRMHGRIFFHEFLFVSKEKAYSCLICWSNVLGSQAPVPLWISCENLGNLVTGRRLTRPCCHFHYIKLHYWNSLFFFLPSLSRDPQNLMGLRPQTEPCTQQPHSKGSISTMLNLTYTFKTLKRLQNMKVDGFKSPL